MNYIKLTNGGRCLVSKINYNTLSKYSWHVSSKGYVLRNCDLFKMHRFILDAPNNMLVDHKNGDTLDNRISNLRLATHQQNMHNMKKREGTINKYKGTRYRKTNNAWESRCRMFNKDFYLGIFKTELSAGWAYEKKAREVSEFYKNQSFPYDDLEMDKLMELDRLTLKRAKFISKYPCVYYKKKSKRMNRAKWSAIVRENKKNKHLGNYDSEEDANIAVIEYRNNNS